jgi:hypothetical protein
MHKIGRHKREGPTTSEGGPDNFDVAEIIVPSFLSHSSPPIDIEYSYRCLSNSLTCLGFVNEEIQFIETLTGVTAVRFSLVSSPSSLLPCVVYSDFGVSTI